MIISMATDCPHGLIHTERLIKNPHNANDFTAVQPPLEYVIEKTCADCGKWIGSVDVRFKDSTLKCQKKDT